MVTYYSVTLENKGHLRKENHANSMESENWSQKLLFLRKSFRSTLTFKAVKWQPVIERIQADSKFTEHLYTAVWCRAPRVAYCLSSFQLVTHRPGAAGSSWLRAAVHQQLLSSACLDRVKNFRPFWHDLPPFLYTLNPSCSPSPGTDRESFGNVSKRKNILSVKGQSEIGIILENITLND